VKRPHPTIHRRNVYKTTFTPTIHTVTSTKQVVNCRRDGCEL